VIEINNPPPSAPYVLLSYQQKWVGDTNPVKIIEKSRRVGLSWAEAADCVLLASQATGMDCWYIGYTKDMALEFIRDCGDWAKQFNAAVGEIEQHEEIFEEGDEKKSILAFTIRFASGYRITALSSSPRNLRGKQGRIIIDEAAFHPDLAELLKAALAMLIWGGQVHIISTHDGEENPFNQLIGEVRAGKKPYSLHRVTLNDAISQGLYQRICLVTSKQWTAEGEAQWQQELVNRYGDGADEELFCVPSKGGGAWIPRTLIEARMVEAPVIRWKAPDGMEMWPDHLLRAEVMDFCERELKPLLEKLNPEWPSYVGEDFARKVDLTVIAPSQVNTSLTRVYPFLVELSKAPFKAQEIIFFYIVDRLPRFSHGQMDAGGNGAYLAEVAKQRYGEARITEVLFSEPWYRDNTAPLKAAFEDGTIVIPKDSPVLDDLAAFRLVRGVPRVPDLRSTDKNGQKRHGDAGIAILLSYVASRTEVYQPYTYEAVRAQPRRPSNPMRAPADDDDAPSARGAGWRNHYGAL